MASFAQSVKILTAVFIAEVAPTIQMPFFNYPGNYPKGRDRSHFVFVEGNVVINNFGIWRAGAFFGNPSTPWNRKRPS